MDKGRCWCGHKERGHRFGVCIWCARMEAKNPQFNFEPGHPFDPRPDAMLERQHSAAQVLDRLLEKPQED